MDFSTECRPFVFNDLGKNHAEQSGIRRFHERVKFKRMEHFRFCFSV